MDKATEYLLLQEAEWQQVTNTLKSSIPTVQKAFLKPNPVTLKKITKKLPQRKLKDVEREAIRTIPGFKKDYLEAQRKVLKLNFISQATAKTAALTTALVSSVTKNDVDSVIRKGEMGVKSAKILPSPSIYQLITLGLFISFIMAIFMSGGDIIMPMIKGVLHVIGLLVIAIGQIIKGLYLVADFLVDHFGPNASADPGSFWDAATKPSGIPGDSGLINPDSIMKWVFSKLGF